MTPEEYGQRIKALEEEVALLKAHISKDQDDLERVDDEKDALVLQIETLKKERDAFALGMSPVEAAAKAERDAALRLIERYQKALLGARASSSLAVQDALDYIEKQVAERPIGEAFAGTPEHLQPSGGSCFCINTFGGKQIKDGCPIHREKRNCDCGIVLPAPGTMCAKCGKVNIRG